MSTQAAAAEISSLTTALQELARRVTAIAERSAGTESDRLAQELFEVERALGEALRRLSAVSQSLGSD